MTTSTTPVKPVPNHKQAGVEAFFGLLFTGGAVSIASVTHAAGAAFPTQAAVVSALIASVLAFVRKESPYLRDLVKFWNVGRKNKNVAEAEAKAIADARAFAASATGKAIIDAAVAASKADPAVAATVADVKTEVTTPAPGGVLPLETPVAPASTTPAA